MQRAKKVWLRAECWVTLAMLEVAQCAFVEANAIGIEVDDGVLPEGQRKYAHDRVLIRAYFERDEARDVITQTVARFFSECGKAAPYIDFVDFEEEDWQGNFVKSCTTFMVAPDIFIVPSFEIDAFRANPQGDLFIEMDPENAFGTGQHQTTKLCLTAIRRIMDQRKDQLPGDCLDVGTGSGILAILMKKLGASSVLATETDDDALHTATKNAQKNGVNITPLLVTEDHQYEEGRYDLVVANILAPVLITMAHNLASCIKPHGEIILSGILLLQAPSVIAAYEQNGLTFIQQDTMDDWCALVLKK